MKNKVINVNWSTVNAVNQPKIDISKLSQEEQADLVVERLKNPPSSSDLLEEALLYILVKMMSDEIDKEVLETLQKGIK